MKIFDRVEEILLDRYKRYGSVSRMYTRTAEMWTGLLGFKVSPDKVIEMMFLYKMIRREISGENGDHVDDLIGYAALLDPETEKELHSILMKE